MASTTTSKDIPGASEQYNHIADAWSVLYPPDGSVFSTLPIAALEDAQLHRALTELVNISGKKILDLACGGGHYTSKFLSWGASSVVGVDISSGMIEEARKGAKARGVEESKLRFLVGDASDDSVTVEGAPFDIVTACWLLNYAPDCETMTKMFKTIGRHLKPGGYFVGMTVPALVTASPHEKDMLNAAWTPEGAWGKYGARGKVLESMPNGDGYKVTCTLGLPELGHPTASFENYYLRSPIFETACVDSGMFEGLDWQDFVIPEEVRKSKPVGFWNDAVLLPEGRICIAKRV